jgi:phage shock protein A
MKTRIMANAAAALFVLLGLSLFSWSQQAGTGSSSMQMQKQQKGGHHSAMMECHQNMQSMRQSNDKLRATIAEAKRSNDPAKMRAALDDAEKSIDSMDNRMDRCMSMMNMMQNMHGQRMMNNSGEMKGRPEEQKTPSATRPPR